MKLISNKWFVIVVMSVVALMISYFLFFGNSSQVTRSISMGGMIIEEKHHYIEPGQYFEM
ncbi:hypothetical protein [Bacillus sp. B15-48]|uniref:hypothetical protein n=1 Tax=Bacillus sp. B15-48 TaxID=1548601 RepID=UPI00193F19F8|nr:hypothetical protein [Bacillus sp. B15-48]MBM4763747.1 hypothetical protein [Bacillus sp. B15-48]